MFTGSRILKLAAAIAIVAGFSFTPFRDMASLPAGIPLSFAATADSCGYSGSSTTYSTTAARSTYAFSESSVLRGGGLALNSSGGPLSLNGFYSDEHALTLGTNANGFSITPFTASYNSTGGTTGTLIAGDYGTRTGHLPPPALSIGDPSSIDPLHRPVYPSLYLTDRGFATSPTTSTSGDWQNGGFGNQQTPDAVLGTWKSFTPGATVNDPAKNNAVLGPNGDPYLYNLNTTANEGYGSEIRWDVSNLKSGGQSLIPGHMYRAQIIVHDGDQNKAGGDTGEGCFNFVMPLNPNITINPPAAINDVGATPPDLSETFTATVTDQNGNPVTNWTVNWTNKNSGPGSLSATSCTTDSNGQCQITLTEASAQTGLTELQACTTGITGGATVGSYNACTDPSKAGQSGGDALKEWVNADIQLTPRTAVNVVNNAHTITATVRQDDGLTASQGGDGVTGFGPAPDGTTVTFSFAQSTPGASFVNGVNTCTTTNGTCSVQINSTDTGTEQVHATTTFSITGLGSLTKSVTRATGTFSSTDNHTDAQKIYINPKTTMFVTDQLTGLDANAAGQVTYMWSTACSGGVLGDSANPVHQLGNVQVFTGATAPISTTNVDVTPGETVYLSAQFTAGTGSSVGNFSTPCSAESATSN